MSDSDVGRVIDDYELEFGMPVTDPLTRPLDRLVDMVLQAFPAIERTLV
jgi:uncharacterized NAD-dependent epimerase/dehydratase family protein